MKTIRIWKIILLIFQFFIALAFSIAGLVVIEAKKILPSEITFQQQTVVATYKDSKAVENGYNLEFDAVVNLEIKHYTLFMDTSEYSEITFVKNVPFSATVIKSDSFSKITSKSYYNVAKDKVDAEQQNILNLFGDGILVPSVVEDDVTSELNEMTDIYKDVYKIFDKVFVGIIVVCFIPAGIFVIMLLCSIIHIYKANKYNSEQLNN